jgi:hypothetical protein
MTTYTGQAAAVDTQDTAAPTLETIEAARAAIAALVSRLNEAMDKVALEAAAHKCDTCGAWAIHDVDVFDYSEELGDESYTGCEKCEPGRAYHREER